MVSFPPNSASKKKIQKTKSPCHRDSGLWTLSLARFIFCAMSSRGYCGPRVADLARRPRTQKYRARIMYIPKIKTLILPPLPYSKFKVRRSEFNVQVAPKSHEGGSTPRHQQQQSRPVKAGKGWSTKKLSARQNPDHLYRLYPSRFPQFPNSGFGLVSDFGFGSSNAAWPPSC